MAAHTLVPVFAGSINNEATLLCDARLLHGFLRVGRRFASWIVERINEYGFVENQDYATISQKREIGHGRGRIDYHLTLDTAKELAMVERNEQGRAVRRYFIECEKELRQQGQVRSTSDSRTPLRAAISMLVGKKSLMYPEAYMLVHQRFGVESIDQLATEQIGQAVEYVHRLVLEGEVLPPEPAKLQLDDATLHNIERLCLHTLWLRGWWGRFGDSLRQLHPRLAACVHDHFIEASGDAHSLARRVDASLPDQQYIANYPWLDECHVRDGYRLKHKQ